MPRSSSISSFRPWLIGSLGGALALFAAFLLASEALLRYWIVPQDNFWQTVGVFYRASAESAAFGDSIVQQDFLPDRPDFPNLASAGERPVQTLTKIQAYYRARPAKRVLLAANPNMVERNIVDTGNYAEIFGRNERPGINLMETRHRVRLIAYWKVLFNEGGFDSEWIVLPNGGTAQKDGADEARYGAASPDARRSEATGWVLADRPLMDARQQTNLTLFSETLAFLQAKQAEVCVVTFPVSPEYRAIAADHPEYAETLAAYRERALAGGARYLSYWDALADPALFSDPAHLTTSAARRFASDVLEDCFALK
jgi:hypothetical protein